MNFEVDNYYAHTGGGEAIHILTAEIWTFHNDKSYIAETRFGKLRFLRSDENPNEWKLITKEQFAAYGSSSIDGLQDLNSIILEFKKQFDFKNIRIIKQNNFRFAEVRKIKEEKIAVELLLFKSKVEEIAIQLEHCYEFCHLFFFEDLPTDIKLREGYMLCKIKNYNSKSLYMLTANWGYIEFSKKFHCEVF